MQQRGEVLRNGTEKNVASSFVQVGNSLISGFVLSNHYSVDRISKSIYE
jgi:hypothetical protein